MTDYNKILENDDDHDDEEFNQESDVNIALNSDN